MSTDWVDPRKTARWSPSIGVYSSYHVTYTSLHLRRHNGKAGQIKTNLITFGSVESTRLSYDPHSADIGFTQLQHFSVVGVHEIHKLFTAVPLSIFSIKNGSRCYISCGQALYFAIGCGNLLHNKSSAIEQIRCKANERIGAGGLCTAVSYYTKTEPLAKRCFLITGGGRAQ